MARFMSARLGQRVMDTDLARSLGLLLALVTVAFLALYNLSEFPVIWFDEGAHLHVPKTLIRYGVYADHSSDGFRYYGPTVGVGPTVLLPIAAVFQLLGVGLLQARLVMVGYLFLAVVLFFRLAGQLRGGGFAWVATALLLTAPGLAFVEYGRQVLGEVPAMAFLLGGLLLWFSTWERSSVPRLLAIGSLLGLSVVTKAQFLLVIGPVLLLAWVANLLFYRSAPQRVFLIPGLTTLGAFLLWQAIMVLYLGPATALENLSLLRDASAGAAFVFSPGLIATSFRSLFGGALYAGLALPGLFYGATLILRRDRPAHQWLVLFLLAVTNLAWYVFASIGWVRYAFPGLSISSLFVASLVLDVSRGAAFPPLKREALRVWQHALTVDGAKWALRAWLAASIAIGLIYLGRQILFPAVNAPAAMAAYLDRAVPADAVIETWEPEIGFLTDHTYHYPPPELLNTAVQHIWLGGPSPGEHYDYIERERPEFLLLGRFGRWVDIYDLDAVEADYQLVVQIGEYDLYAADGAQP